MNTLIVIIFASLSVLSTWEIIIKKRLSSLFFILSVVAVIAIAFRDVWIVPDTYVYLDAYKLLRYPNYNFLSLDNYYLLEQGYLIFTQLIRNIFKDNYIALFAVIPILNITLITFAVKKICNIGSVKMLPSVLITLYFGYYGLLYNAIILRASLAFSLGFLALVYSFEKKWIRCILLILLAYSFHQTAVVFIFIILISLIDYEFKKLYYWVFLLISGLIYIFQLGSIVTKPILHYLSNALNETVYSSYIMKTTFEEGYSLKFLFFFILSILFLTLKDNNKYYRKFLNIYFFGIFVYSIMCSMDYLTRFTDFFIFFSFILLYLYILRQKDILYACFIFSFSFIVQLILVLRIINLV